MDIDYAIRKDEPPALTDTGTAADITLYERWERSNCLSMMLFKTRISVGIRGSVDQHEKVRDLLKAIDEQFVTSDKALASTLIMKFSSLRLANVKGVREHIMQIKDNVAQLKKLEAESAMRATRGKGKSQANKKGKGKIPPQAGIKKDSKCFFCKKKGHIKKECVKFQKWLADKESHPSTSSDRLVIVYSTPQVQTGVEQPIVEVPQAADNIPVDQVV
ncbi:hypothetical protein MRB53_007221 [Persea americana]|uniref:Uncharacterized protein n=1 Tax=Persea americana TaxID=3435 RepID=A0ACC2MIK3_PERAE|nr:hypothetical protein MRB53_007221 [Persea americana]